MSGEEEFEDAGAAGGEPPPSLVTREEVMFFDTDAGGIVHNLAYLRFIETCRTRLAVKMGMHMREMVSSGVTPVLLRTEVDYRRPAVLSDVLEIYGELERLERARFWCSFRVVRPADGALLVTCRQSLALVQMAAGKPLRLPEEWRRRWPELCGSGT